MYTMSHGMSDCGRVRGLNEDAFFCNDPLRVYAVADGLGGLPGGAHASRSAIEMLKKHVSAPQTRSPFDMDAVIRGINSRITDTAREHHPLTGTGTTFTAGQIIDKKLYIGHVGDSAAYLCRHGKLVKLTTDHTMEQEFIKAMGPETSATMPKEFAHTLTRCIGQMEDFEVDHYETTLRGGDRLLFCSDGVNKVLENDRIAELMTQGRSPEECCRTLIDAANDAGGPDNVTTVVVFLKEKPN